MSFQTSLRWSDVNASTYKRNNSHVGDVNGIRYNPNGVGGGLLPEDQTGFNGDDQTDVSVTELTFSKYEAMYANALPVGAAVTPTFVEVVAPETPAYPQSPAPITLLPRVLIDAA